MYKKRALVMGCYLSLLALAACGPKVIDDADIVSVDYIYSFSDGTVVDQGTKEFTVGENEDSKWMEGIIRGAKEGDEFVGKINGKELYKYDDAKVQAFQNIHITEVMGISDPKIGTNIYLNSIGSGVIIGIEKDSDGYDSYITDFNDPKTYSELSYVLKVISIEKD